MKISTKSRYALNLMLELALHEVSELLPPAAQSAEELSVCAAAIGAAIQ